MAASLLSPHKKRSGSPWGRRAYSALRTPALASRPVPGLTCLADTFYGYFRNDASAALQSLHRVAPSARHVEIVAGERSGNHPPFVARVHRNACVRSKLPPTARVGNKPLPQGNTPPQSAEQKFPHVSLFDNASHLRFVLILHVILSLGVRKLSAFCEQAYRHQPIRPAARLTA